MTEGRLDAGGASCIVTSEAFEGSLLVLVLSEGLSASSALGSGLDSSLCCDDDGGGGGITGGLSVVGVIVPRRIK